MENLPERPGNHCIYVDFNKQKDTIYNRYEGKTGIVIANGPSKERVPDDFLLRYPSIGVNNVYLRGMSEAEVKQYPGISPKFYPTFYCILGLNQLNDNVKAEYPRPLIEAAELAFVNRIAYPVYHAENVYAIHGIRLSTHDRPNPKETFSYDIMDYVGISYTITYVALQIMYYLGFTKIYMVGLDNDYGADPGKLHNYPNDPRFACEPSMGRTAFRKGSDYVFSLAKQAYEADGRRIINLHKNDTTVFEHRVPEWEQ